MKKNKLLPPRWTVNRTQGEKIWTAWALEGGNGLKLPEQRGNPRPDREKEAYLVSYTGSLFFPSPRDLDLAGRTVEEWEVRVFWAGEMEGAAG